MTNLDHLDHTDLATAGGKAANLAALTTIDGIHVPRGFCVTTDAFDRCMGRNPTIMALLDRLDAGDEVTSRLREAVEQVPLPDDILAAIDTAVQQYSPDTAFAVRSSAVAEDSPGASFAGQHDSYLDVVGIESVHRDVRRCWASLFSERAVAYRRNQGLDQRDARMAVVVQHLVAAEVSGVLFTADPLTGNRKVATVEATWGLGEAFVSGRVTGDVYRVDSLDVVDAAPAETTRRALTDDQVRHLVRLGRRVEAHFGRPQDIEWCLVGDDVSFVQSRPITTLFPVPERTDDDNHVYLSVGHQQMMTDAMRPLGLSFWQLTTPVPMAEAGGRLFVDVTRRLAAPAARAALLEVIGKSDPLTIDALHTVLGRDGFIRPLPDPQPPTPSRSPTQEPIEPDPAVVAGLIAHSEASVQAARDEISTRSGVELFEFIRTDLLELRRILFDPRSHQVFMAAMDATAWLNEHLESWLDEQNAADTLTQSVPHNITSQMGLALLDVADVIRPHPAVVTALEQVEDEEFLERLAAIDGGRESRDAIEGWLDRFGMRCAGEIDITRDRWRERPSTLLPTILTNVRTFAAGAAERRFAEGLRQARQKEHELLARLRELPDGAPKAEQSKQMIDLVRAFIGYREYPKYGMVSRYFVYKQALLREAARLAGEGVLAAAEDVYYLTFDEFEDVVRTNRVDPDLVTRRRAEFRSHATLVPPRVLTSDGESINGAYRRDGAPPGALVGLAVSTGVVEGRARVATDMASARLSAGDILVTAYTDPSWTPLFLTAAGLVTEVGGLMTHGAVVAREYGLPAVVGITGATRLIRDGRRIRVDGATGVVELLDD